jgi:hypothetical protein
MATETKKVKVKMVVLTGDIGANDKCPPQSRLIVDTLKAVEGGRISRADLIKLLSRPVDAGGLKTNQPPERIYGFYRPKLTAAGVIREEEEEQEIQVEVPDKPAEAEKPAKEPKAKKVKADAVKGAVGEKKVEGEAATAA